MTITRTEQADIDRANRTGRQPVVFVHGLWLLPNSWDSWRTLFEEQGFVTLAPGWPDDPATVEDARRDPSVYSRTRVSSQPRYSASMVLNTSAP